MKPESIRWKSQKFDPKDVELTMRLRTSPADYVVFEIKDGEVKISAERTTVADVPFKKKKRR